jgi:hypothetical protein
MKTKFIAILLISCIFGSCATIIPRKKRTLSIISTPAGADIYAENKKFIGKTPYSFETRKIYKYFTLYKDEYSPTSIATDTEMRGTTWWNLLFTGPLGIVFDLATGGINKYASTYYSTNLTAKAVKSTNTARPQENTNKKAKDIINAVQKRSNENRLSTMDNKYLMQAQQEIIKGNINQAKELINQAFLFTSLSKEDFIQKMNFIKDENSKSNDEKFIRDNAQFILLLSERALRFNTDKSYIETVYLFRGYAYLCVEDVEMGMKNLQMAGEQGKEIIRSLEKEINSPNRNNSKGRELRKNPNFKIE